MTNHDLRAQFDRKANQLLRDNHALNELGLSNDHRIEAVNDMRDILLPEGY